MDKLDFKGLNPQNSRYCIYGQMTGDCYGARATELVEKCASKVFQDMPNGFDEITNYKVVAKKRGRFNYWSPIEAFIFKSENRGRGNNNETLVKFLKGEIKTLKFK